MSLFYTIAKHYKHLPNTPVEVHTVNEVLIGIVDIEDADMARRNMIALYSVNGLHAIERRYDIPIEIITYVVAGEDCWVRS